VHRCPAVNYLIDTNIVIPLEPTAMQDLDVNTEAALMFHRLASAHGQAIFVHPAIQHDLGRDRNRARAKLRSTLLSRYQQLRDPPAFSTRLARVVGEPPQGSNDWVDASLLAALEKDAVDYLVTEDAKIHRHAERLGLASRTLTLGDAIASLRTVSDEPPAPPPAVESLEAYALNEKDPIFESFRTNYSGFDAWLAKCKRQHRLTYAIGSQSKDGLAAVCILNREDKNEYELTGKVLKICTFKVADQYSGKRFGELLLKPVFDYAMENAFDHIFITMFEDQQPLRSVLKSFGFEELRRRSRLGEVVMVKRLRWSEAERQRLPPFEFHRLFGPWVTKLEDNPMFVVPLRPVYHDLLFPERADQKHLFPGHAACGNSIKKAYLCHSGIRGLSSGNNLLFYRSGDMRAATAVGIVEDTLVSSTPATIIQYVGTRTVYSPRQIASLCSRGRVLAIRFRRVAFFAPPIPYSDLANAGCLADAPQSIQRLPRKGVKWLTQQLPA